MWFLFIYCTLKDFMSSQMIKCMTFWMWVLDYRAHSMIKRLKLDSLQTGVHGLNCVVPGVP